MSLGTYLLGATLTLVLVSVCYGGICDEGPPGKFCFANLTGYDDCHVDPKTKKMVDDKHNCTKNTRCTCMGIPCSAKNPCGKFTLPPKWPEDYHIDYNVIDKICSPASCHTTYSRCAIWRDTKNRKFRIDRTISTSGYDIFIVLPSNHSLYEMYHIVPSQTSCTKTATKSFPAFPDIPPTYKYDGTEVIAGIVSKRWLWKSGGRNSGQQIITTIWNSYGDKPLEGRYNDPGSQMSKTSRNAELYVGLFIPGTPDPGAFELPGYCEKERERFPKPDLEQDAILEAMKLPF